MITTRSRGNNLAPLSGGINVTELQQNDPEINVVYQSVKQNQKKSHAEVSKLSPAFDIIGTFGTPFTSWIMYFVRNSIDDVMVTNTSKS